MQVDQKRKKRQIKIIWRSLLLSFFVWATFTWPLPLHVAEGIPCSTQNVEKDHVRVMIPGDHLQLMYHFQLFQDFLSGDTPWFHNLYEFNVGDDSETRRVRAYFFPFSLLFAVAGWMTNDAFAWNLCGFVSIWFSIWFTVLLVRQFVDHPLVPYTVSVIALCLPWRWVNLLGGSPMGLAMCWMPALWLGISVVMREKKWQGGVVAGLASLFMALGDFQTYYFSLLSIPAWMLLLVIRFNCQEQWRAMIRPALPAVGIAALGLGYAVYAKKGHAASSISGGRSLDEVAISSPVWQNFFHWQETGLASHPYLGYLLVFLLCASLFLVVWKLKGRERIFGLLLFAGIAGVIALGLGMNGPLHGHLMTGMRKVIPSYDKIRQPLKIWCLLPTLVAVFLAIGRSAVIRAPHRPLRRTLIISLALALMIENELQIRPTISILETENKAYAAVAAESDAPRAIAIPLWPGDSDWSSLYEYYGVKYRVRMLNGYSPVVKSTYKEIYMAYRSLNQGVLEPHQVHSLMDRGIHHVVLHENAFPEKVSPWPVDQTLRSFHANPYLTPEGQDGPVHSFRLRREPQERDPDSAQAWDMKQWPRVYFPAQRYNAEGIPTAGGNVEIIQDSQALGGQALQIHDAGVTMHSHRPVLMLNRHEGWIRGKPELNAAYRWYPLKPLPLEFQTATFHHEPAQGEVLDFMFYGSLLEELPRKIPAASFFHGGYSVPYTGAVHLRPLHDHKTPFYGYLIPRIAGSIRMTVYYRAPEAPAGARLGHFEVSQNTLPETALIHQPGQPLVMTLVFTSNLPTKLEFHYDRTYPVTLERFELE